MTKFHELPEQPTYTEKNFNPKVDLDFQLGSTEFHEVKINVHIQH